MDVSKKQTERVNRYHQLMISMQSRATQRLSGADEELQRKLAIQLICIRRMYLRILIDVYQGLASEKRAVERYCSIRKVAYEDALEYMELVKQLAALWDAIDESAAWISSLREQAILNGLFSSTDLDWVDPIVTPGVRNGGGPM